MDKIISLLIRWKDRITLSQGALVTTPHVQAAQAIFHNGRALTICGTEAETVDWDPGNITLRPLQTGKDVFSFKFSGCVFARYFTSRGQPFAAHIGTDTDSDSDCKDTWIDYVNTNGIIQLRMFRPDAMLMVPLAGLIGTNGIQILECWGVISREGNCYTLIVSLKSDSTYRLELIRQHFVGTTVFDFRPLFRHGIELPLPRQAYTPQNKDILQRRCDVTSRNWRQFWGGVRHADVYDRATAPPPPPAPPVGGGTCYVL